jgi:hypothetical protein
MGDQHGARGKEEPRGEAHFVAHRETTSPVRRSTAITFPSEADDDER